MRLLLLALALTPAAAQWQLQPSNTTASLRGIHAVSDQIAWASGTNGTVLHTTDGGSHWLPCTTPPQAEHLDFRGIQAFDATTAIVMSSGKGDLSRLYKTTDACQIWTLVFTNPDSEGFWDAIQFDRGTNSAHFSAKTANGILIGDPVRDVFEIYESTNGGDMWKLWNANDLKHQPRSVRGESLFAASNQAIVAPGSNGPFAFVTGGAKAQLYLAQPHSPFDAAFWYALTPKSLPLSSGKSAGAFALASRHGDGSPFADLMIVGGDYLKPDAASPTVFVPGTPRFLLGTKGSQHALTPPHGYRSAVAYLPAHKAWITVGPNGTDLSTDDGRNWHALRPSAGEAPDSDKNWNALSLPFVVGPNGRIGRLRPNALP